MRKMVTVLLVGVLAAGASMCAVRTGRRGRRGEVGDSEGHLEFQGRSRFYELHVPPGYRSGTPTPVVLVFHGGGGWPSAMRYQSGMDRVSDREGFIAAYPGGTGFRKNRMLTFNAGICCSYAVERNVDDVGFTAAVIDDLAAHYTIDRDRVFATGLSNGAMMAYRLACELADRIAAVAPVSGTMGVSNCAPSRPVSVMHFHGLEDQNSPYAGGIGKHSVSGVIFRSVDETIRFWVQHDGCPQTPTTSTQGECTRFAYGPCREGSEVVLWRIGNGGHAWPGGKTTMLEKLIVGRVSNDISASDLMWEFFKRHTLHGGQAG